MNGDNQSGTGVPTRRTNILVFAAIVLLIAPTAVSAVTHDELTSQSVDTADRIEAESVTFVSLQGREIGGQGARLVAFDTESKESIWTHSRYQKAYYDVDPLNESTVLFVAGNDTDWYAVVMNWRTDEVYERFPVPKDTHDVDHLGGNQYAVADMDDDRAFVYDSANDTVIWEFDFRDRYPPGAGGGDGYSDDYTHLNDIDAHDNGSTFLVSPRNFDRVMLLNRSTDQVEWTLGSEDDFSVLYEQHNPALISDSPPTVLVADSENDRVVEYRRTGEGWELVWEYRGKLHWPRDADRLPNGNTLIVDSRGDRVLEVTPDREVVWELRIAKFPYDVERVSLGDEPRGPPMTEFASAYEGARDPKQRTLVVQSIRRFQWAYDMSQWLLPHWVSAFDFGALVLALGLGVMWSFYRGGALLRERVTPKLRDSKWEQRPDWIYFVGAAALLVAGGVVGAIEIYSNFDTATFSLDFRHLNPFYLGLAFLLGFQSMRLLTRSQLVPEAIRKAANISRYPLSVAGLLLGAKTLQLFLTHEDVRPYIGMMLLLGLYCGPALVRPLTQRVTPKDNQANRGLGLLIMSLGAFVSLFSVQSFYPFGTFFGPGLIIFVTGWTWLKNGESRSGRFQPAAKFSYALELVFFSVTVIAVVLAVGLGSGILTVEMLAFGLLSLGTVLHRRSLASTTGGKHVGRQVEVSLGDGEPSKPQD